MEIVRIDENTYETREEIRASAEFPIKYNRTCCYIRDITSIASITSITSNTSNTSNAVWVLMSEHCSTTHGSYESFTYLGIPLRNGKIYDQLEQIWQKSH
jgi:hypothetical protein